MSKQSNDETPIKAHHVFITLTPSKVKPLEYANQTIIFPVIGEVTTSEKGTVEVPSDKVKAFVEATKDAFGFYEHVEGESTKPKSKIQQYSEEYVKTKAELDLLKFEDLVSLAKDSGLEPSDLLTMTNGKIKAELLKKLVPND